ncbi:hypothetical protein [Aliiglaciecola sp. M165]|uniref:hypothetical protein n=1 Tax=Aliiglaciecola sp. M165 TaxID=2593649 RepID=UPI0011811E3F|nr:hypothetical protein [Aliiglaciecola sp. M165]TRY31540.1 hypothetical protein FM019_11775 [Aliiglaciecola sp. M165]
MAKPSEFYVGVIDLFAILLPGSIATAILEPYVGSMIFGQIIFAPDSAGEKWVAFLAVAYFLGHLIFLLGSYIDPLYNGIREKLNPYGNTSAFTCASNLRDSLIDEPEQKALNTFQWSRSVLLTCSPAAAQDVHRLEADSKFFRSLLVVCLLVGVVFLFDGKVVAGVISLALIFPCFARYYERRLKSTTQAYIHVLTLNKLGKLSLSEPSITEK